MFISDIRYVLYLILDILIFELLIAPLIAQGDKFQKVLIEVPSEHWVKACSELQKKFDLSTKLGIGPSSCWFFEYSTRMTTRISMLCLPSNIHQKEFPTQNMGTCKKFFNLA